MNNGNGNGDGDNGVQRLLDLGTHIHAATTRLAYDTQYRQFTAWCEAQGRWDDVAPAYPPEAVCEYLAVRAEMGQAYSTLMILVCAIKARTRDAGVPDPTRHELVRRALRGASRLLRRNSRQATGLTHRDMLKIRPIAKPKQWALLCLMRDCLLRRSEASAARWRDLVREPDGSGRLTVPHSKTDQTGKGAVLYVTDHTMLALKVIRPWPTPAVGEKIFGWSAGSISRNISQLAERAGLKGDYSGHSPRVGMAQDLARLGASLPEMQNAGRWKNPSMPALYCRSIDASESAVAKFSEFLMRD